MYYQQHLGMDLLKSGIFSVLPWITMAVFANVGGWLADSLIHKGMSVTRVRKIMQTVRCLLLQQEIYCIFNYISQEWRCAPRPRLGAPPASSASVDSAPAVSRGISGMWVCRLDFWAPLYSCRS